MLTLAPYLVNVAITSHCAAVLDIMPGHLRKKSWFSERRDLLMLLTKFVGSRAHEPADRVYALLAISADACDAKVFSVNYENSERQIAERLIRFWFPSSPRRSLHLAKDYMHSLDNFLDALPDIYDAARLLADVDSVKQMVITRTVQSIGGNGTNYQIQAPDFYDGISSKCPCKQKAAAQVRVKTRNVDLEFRMCCLLPHLLLRAFTDELYGPDIVQRLLRYRYPTTDLLWPPLLKAARDNSKSGTKCVSILLHNQ